MSRVLITGITGFVGSHLAEYLLSTRDTEGTELSIYGTVRWRSRMENISGIRDRVTLVECDLCDAFAVNDAVRLARPDYVFHLAAQSFVPTSWTAPSETLVNNIIGELNLLEAIHNERLDARVQIAGSSEEYGLVLPDEVPIRETNPLRPLSPYAVSKIAQDYLGFQYYRSYGMHVVRTRAFNHTGPRRGEVFVTSNLAKQIAAIERGKQPPILQVGNLEAVRDFLDVRDVVRAYWLAVTLGEPGEVYNIASGVGRKVGEVVDLVRDMTAMDVRVEQHPARLRPSDVPVLIGDSSKFRERTGWSPAIPFHQTIRDLLDYWRSRS